MAHQTSAQYITGGHVGNVSLSVEKAIRVSDDAREPRIDSFAQSTELCTFLLRSKTRSQWMAFGFPARSSHWRQLEAGETWEHR